MIKNEDAYYQGYYRNVRALGTIPALVFDTICGLIREKGIGEIANSTLLEMLGIKSKHTLNDAIDKIIEVGYIEKQAGDGRGNKCIYYITEKGLKNAPFINKKGGRICTERGQNLHGKGAENAPINTVLNEELNKNNLSSSFEVQNEPAKFEEREEDKIFIEKENINNPEDEQKALEDVKNLFAQDEIGNETKSSFAEFWKLFNPDEDQKCKYKVALYEWNRMEENWRAAAITLFQRGARTSERNPYFFLQHFRPTKYFLNEHEQYNAYKQGIQLCRVRWNGGSRVMAALFADVFKMEILDDHYEKRFE